MNLEQLQWSIAEGQVDSVPIWIRFRQFPLDFPRTSYPERLNIFWQMTELDEGGAPTIGEMERSGTFENRLVAAVEPDGFGVLAIVLTGGGQREYVFHTSDPSGFVQRLTEMPQEEERYPIAIYRHADPEWAYDQAVLDDYN
jgi:hypothetical protein